MTAEESVLAALVARIVDIRCSAVKISPAWIATEAMRELDPGRRSVDLVFRGCHLHLRQLAREQLRKRFEDRDGESPSDQHEMFPQLRQPCEHGTAPVVGSPPNEPMVHLPTPLVD